MPPPANGCRVHSSPYIYLDNVRFALSRRVLPISFLYFLSVMSSLPRYCWGRGESLSKYNIVELFIRR
jgi:hypothetical protein